MCASGLDVNAAENHFWLFENVKRRDLSKKTLLHLLECYAACLSTYRISHLPCGSLDCLQNPAGSVVYGLVKKS